jgi:MutT/NUDIX family protein
VSRRPYVGSYSRRQGSRRGGDGYPFFFPNISPYSGLDVYTADTFWLVRVPTFEGAEARDDAAELVIVEPRELEVRHFGLTSVRSSIKRLLGDLSLLEGK